jgi:uncharacterized glyoxalase superfamily protein PhnB
MVRQTNAMNDNVPSKTVWPCVNYKDAQAAIRFLVDVLGFDQTAVYLDDAGRVAHAELRWPEGGGVMLGDADREEGEFSRMPTSCAAVYVVTDDPDAVYDRAMTAGTELVRELRDEDYGSRGFSVRDVEGNIWSFGTYRGE